MAPTNNTPFMQFTKQLTEVCGRKSASAWPKVLVVTGGSEYLVYKSTQAIKAAWVEVTRNPYTTINATDINLDEIEKLGGQQAMFDPVTMYHIPRIDQVKNIFDHLAELPESAKLSNYICLSFVGRQNDKLKKFVKKSAAEVIGCHPPKPSELKGYIQKLGRKYKLDLDWETVQFLADMIGDDLSALDNEVGKLALIFPEGQRIDPQDIRQMIDYQREELAYHLRSHIMQGRFGNAQLLLTELLRRGESALGILGLIAKHCRVSLQVKHLRQQGDIPKSIAQKTGLQNFLVNQYTKYSMNHSEAKFSRALTMCAQVDRKLKTSKMDQEILLGQALEALR